MKLNRANAGVFIPDGLSEIEALKRTTHMAIAAHPDDIEIMAIDGILNCFHQQDRWFTGVIMTDGSGSPRDGLYQDYSDRQMREVRLAEQKKAAILGEYAARVFLDYPSSVVKNPENYDPVEDLQCILRAAQPEIIYTHNLADKHPTHVAVSLRAIQAIRNLPKIEQPKRVFGCEVWRDLDWLLNENKVVFDCSNHEDLQMALLEVFDSQISGGKRYDLATMGRRRAHATFYAPYEVDAMIGMAIGMDLTPLIRNPEIDVHEYLQRFIDCFSQDVHQIIDDVS